MAYIGRSSGTLRQKSRKKSPGISKRCLRSDEAPIYPETLLGILPMIRPEQNDVWMLSATTTYETDKRSLFDCRTGAHRHTAACPGKGNQTISRTTTSNDLKNKWVQPSP